MQARFISLDGLRGVAAVLVAFGHACSIVGYNIGSFGLSVDLFFMISGFVIPHAYEARLRRGAGGGGLTFRRFMEARLIRLYPLYILGVAISLVPYVVFAIDGALWQLRDPLTQLPWAILLLPEPHWESQRSFMLNLPAWSLFLEIVINIAYVAVLPWLTTRVLAVIAVIAACGLTASVVHFGTIYFGSGGIEMLFGLFRVACPFTIGALLYRGWKANRLPLVHMPSFVPIIAFFAVLAVPAGFSMLLVVLLAFPLLIVAALGARPVGRQARMFDWLGQLSYPLYMLHLPLLMMPRQLASWAGLDQDWATVAAFPFGVAIAAAMIGPDVKVRAYLTKLAKLLRSDVNAAPAL